MAKEVEIRINNIKMFDRLIVSMLKLVERCQIVVNEKGCAIKSINDAETIRAFYDSNVLTSKTPIKLNIGDIKKLSKCISALNDFKDDKENTAVMLADPSFLRMKDVIEFKLHLIADRLIDKNTAMPLKNTYDPDYSFTMSNELMKKMSSMAFIDAETDQMPKIYIYKKDKYIVGEIDDKTNALTDSIQIPISSVFDGDWSLPIITKLDRFTLWNPLNAKEVKVTKTIQKVIQSTSLLEYGKNYIEVMIASSGLKK